jgi:hypothetical protein
VNTANQYDVIDSEFRDGLNLGRICKCLKLVREFESWVLSVGKCAVTDIHFFRPMESSSFNLVEKRTGYLRCLLVQNARGWVLSSKLILFSWLLSYIEHLHPYPLFESVLNWCLKNNNESEEDFFFLNMSLGQQKLGLSAFVLSLGVNCNRQHHCGRRS